MEALHMQPFEEKVLMLEDQEQDESSGQKEGGMEASDAESDDDSEPEPPLVVQRKVSFADAFGLNLVSVKEFDNADVTESEVNQDLVSEATHPLEEFYISCLFTVPSCSEELDQRLQAQMVELESIELLPGTSMLRGNIRVVNLCFDKSVYARMTLDRWTSYFDLLAEYVPGSSDRKTDRFTFKYTLIPPFEKEGTRVEFCLRYQTSEGTFWANNNRINYVLFCHQRGHVREQRPPAQEESCNYRSKRSCLKANWRGSTQEKALETSYTSTVIAEGEAAHKARKAALKTKDSAEIKSELCHEEHQPLVASIKSRQRATRLARVQEQLAKRRQQVPKAYSHDSAKGQERFQPLTPTLVDTAGFPHGHPKKKPSNHTPQVLTYHQIPLLTLDWNNDKIQQWGSANIDDIWTGRTKTPLLKASAENMEVTPSNNHMWETFSSGTDDTIDKGSSVCDEWQSFLNGTSFTDHFDVPESEWLQTATSVSPSKDNEPKAQYVSSSQTHVFQVGTDPPTTFNSHTSVACHMLSNSRQTSLASVALNMDDHQPAEACVSSPRNDNTATQEASQRSQTNLVTDTLQEFSLKGVTPVSEGCVDGLTECHEHAMWEREREGIMGGAEGIERAEHTADLVTGSGESETTRLIEMPESQNASAVDRISQGARLDVGLSSSKESEVTGNAMDDTLAFQETIKQGTKHGERFVLPTSRQEEEKGIMNNCIANEVSAMVQVFRPQKTEGCEISQRYADEKYREEFRLNQNSENPLLQENESSEIEIRPAQLGLDKFNPNQMCEDNFKESQMRAGQFRLDKIENLEVYNLTGVESTFCTSCGETERLMGAEAEIIKVLNEELYQYKALQLNPSRQGDNTFILSVHEKQSRPIQATKELCYQENGLESKTGEHSLDSNQKEEGTSLRCHGIIEEQQEKNISAQTRHTVEQSDMMKAFHDHDTIRSFPTDKCNPNALEVSENKWNHLQGDMKGQKEDVGNETKTEQVTAKETVGKADSSTELQHQSELLEIIEGDMSQRDKDERGSIGKLKIEAQGELMDNEENPQGEKKNAPAILEEQELSAEVESSPHVECKKLSEGTKEPIKAESTKTIEAMELELEEMSVERFGEDLVKRIWEEVFGEKVQACKRDTDITNGTGDKSADIPDSPQICHLLKDSNNAFDLGIELPMDPNLSTSQDLEQTLVLECNESSSKEGSKSLSKTEQTYFLSRDSQAQTDLTLSAHLSQDLNPILAAKSQQSLTEPAESSRKDNENDTQIKGRAVVYKETVRQTEESRVTNKGSFNQSSHESHRVPQKLEESDLLVWWSMIYILSHYITRLVVCAFLVAGFFVMVFLYDFPLSLALYIFSMCYLFSQWKRQVTTNKGMVG
uniref:CBM21 domain-containing protein n=1 Tax=Labrus bergylta TaxID=56723 RepID=A0A3Q3GHP9_9LABR